MKYIKNLNLNYKKQLILKIKIILNKFIIKNNQKYFYYLRININIYSTIV